MGHREVEQLRKHPSRPLEVWGLRVGDLLREWNQLPEGRADSWIATMGEVDDYEYERNDDGSVSWTHLGTHPYEILGFNRQTGGEVLTIVYARRSKNHPGPAYVAVIEPHAPGRARHARDDSPTEYRVCGHVDRAAVDQITLF